MIGRLLAWWWAPVAVALAAVVAWETDWGEGLHRPVVVPPLPAPKPVAPALLPEYKPAGGPELYAEVVDRPLFSPSRKPAPPPPPPEQPKPAMATGQYQLTGTVQVGDKLYAFLKETKTGRGIRAAQGDVLSTGLKLAKVEPDRIVLSQYDSEEEVKMLVAKSTRTTPVAPPPVPMPGAPATAGIPGAPQPPGIPVPGMHPGIPQTAAVPGIPPAQQPLQPTPPTSIRPGAEAAQPTVVPFVPGVSPASDAPANRRRGAPQ
jgi:hypothetical protein